MKQLAIIGGGAAGLAAAVEAGAQARKAGVDLHVTVYEADDRVGRPILRSGNGRCNFSNASVAARDYHNDEFVGRALLNLMASARTRWEDPITEFFAGWGLVWTEEKDGRRYPATGKATTVLNVLRAAEVDLGVEERCGCAVETVEPPREAGGRYTLRLRSGELVRADAVIVAVGGEVVPSLLTVDLPFCPLRPVLGPLDAHFDHTGGTPQKEKNRAKGGAAAKDGDLLNLNNIRVDAQVTLRRGDQVIHQEEGELLFRKYGVSGIVVFNVSRFAEPGDLLEVDLVPWLAENDHGRLFSRRKRLASHFAASLTWEDMLRGLVLPPVAQVVAKVAGAGLAQPFAKTDVERLLHALKHLALRVDGVHDGEGQCQVHRGGVAVDAVSARDCQVKGHPGLYIVGEALDVDAPCGGYNLHWAWTSGLLAARSVVDALAADGAEAEIIAQ